jgi:hypothetical protein
VESSFHDFSGTEEFGVETSENYFRHENPEVEAPSFESRYRVDADQMLVDEIHSSSFDRDFGEGGDRDFPGGGIVLPDIEKIKVDTEMPKEIVKTLNIKKPVLDKIKLSRDKKPFQRPHILQERQKTEDLHEKEDKGKEKEKETN